MKTAIIVGASSGIGRALAVALSKDGYRVGILARRTELLEQLQTELASPCAIKTVDVSQPEARGSGHIVGISSVAGLRGIGGAPAYSASKAFMSTYLQALRYRFTKMNIPVVVTDVLPGFVDTAMGKSQKRFWVTSTEIAARQIVTAIHRRRSRVYVTRRWRLIGWLMKIVPDAVYSRI